jgi:5,10-methenyltetrahydromethanopterin hydrogenase
MIGTEEQRKRMKMSKVTSRKHFEVSQLTVPVNQTLDKLAAVQFVVVISAVFDKDRHVIVFDCLKVLFDV